MVMLRFLEQSRSKYLEEIISVSTIHHPNIASVYDFGEYKDFNFIVLELNEGKTLRERISEGSLNLNEILDILIQVGKALVAAHNVGIVHRDIKPENILISSEGNVKVLDFGLARLSKSDNLSGIKSTAGTPAYMSPEQIEGEAINFQADIWSLGVILFEMIAEERPFQGNSFSDIAAAILNQSLPKITKYTSKSTSKIDLILAKALEKERTKRFQSMEDFVSALQSLKRSLVFGEAESRQSFQASTILDFMFMAGISISIVILLTGSAASLFFQTFSGKYLGAVADYIKPIFNMLMALISVLFILTFTSKLTKRNIEKIREKEKDLYNRIQKNVQIIVGRSH